MANLFELNQAEYEILERLENEEFTFEDIKDTLDAIQDEKHRKYDFMQKMVLSLKGDVNTLKEREDALNKRRKGYEAKIKSLQNYMYESIKQSGESKFKTSEFTFYFIKRKSIDDHNPALIPDKYWKPQPPKLDKTLLKEDIDNGVEVEGAVLVENESLGVR